MENQNKMKTYRKHWNAVLMYDRVTPDRYHLGENVCAIDYATQNEVSDDLGAKIIALIEKIIENLDFSLKIKKFITP